MIEIRTQGSGREELFPQAWGEEVDIKDGIHVYTLQHVDEIDGCVNFQASEIRQASRW